MTEIQTLLEGLVLSSERFDYPKAKTALRRLSRKVRDLGKVRAAFEAQLRARAPHIQVIDFRGGGPATRDSRQGP